MDTRNRVMAASLSLLLGLGACSSNAGQESSVSDSSRPTQSTTAAQTTSRAPEPSATQPPQASASHDMRDVVEQPPASTWQQALAKAQEKYQGRPSKIELESDDAGRLHYKIEILSASDKQAAQYDADDLSELSHKTDSLGSDAAKKQKQTYDVRSLVSLDQAAKAARASQPGTITDWKLEGKDTGRVQYQFDIVPSGASQDVEVTVDATDASVISDR